MAIDLAVSEARPAASAREAASAPAPLLAHILPSFALGGVQVRLARVIAALGHRYRHRIVALDGNGTAAALIDPALGVEIVAAPFEKHRLVRTLPMIHRWLRASTPDLLLTYNWGTIEWALANSLFGTCRHVHFEDGFGPDEADQRLRRRSVLRRIALVRTARIIVPSRNLEAIARREWRLPANRVRYIANGIDADGFAAEAPGPPLFERRHDEVIVGTVAPLRPEKNVARLIRVFAKLDAAKPLRLAIAGGGAQRDELEALARSLGVSDRTIFLGSVTAPRRALALFDIFALSSNTEQMPMSVLEAMAVGLPVVSVDVGDVKAMLAPENRRYIVAKNDEQSFAKALGDFATAPKRRAELGALNHTHVRRHYSWEAMVDEYDRIFGIR